MYSGSQSDRCPLLAGHVGIHRRGNRVTPERHFDVICIGICNCNCQDIASKTTLPRANV